MMARETYELLMGHAQEIAHDHGIAALTIRGLADASDVAVGTVYRYFKSKSELTVATIATFFKARLFDRFCVEGEDIDFVAYCRDVTDELDDVFDEFKNNWLKNSSALPSEEREAGRIRETQVIEHIRQGLAYAFEHDPRIDPDNLPSGVDSESISILVLDTIVAKIRGQGDMTALLFLLEKGLHCNPPVAQE